MARPRMVEVSVRMSETMRDELRKLAEETSAVTGRRVTRSDIERSMLADGIRRARQAPQYVARLAPETVPGGEQ